MRKVLTRSESPDLSKAVAWQTPFHLVTNMIKCPESTNGPNLTRLGILSSTNACFRSCTLTVETFLRGVPSTGSTQRTCGDLTQSSTTNFFLTSKRSTNT
ncbi:hypothetical protein LB505_009473 [Fusarium chuoi]|nr:hypothetical protein LB505_009473 [Fusarium chuoi]